MEETSQTTDVLDEIESDGSPPIKTERINPHLLLKYTLDIIDKQYRSYTWNDGKVHALLTIDTALIAGMLLIFQIFKPVNWFALASMGASAVLLLFSFIFCLKHIIPKLDSGIGNQQNMRTMIGISRLDKSQYQDRMLNLSLDDMIRMNCWQISGMAKNNVRSYKLIKKGVIFTIIAAFFVFLTLPFVIIPDLKSQTNSTSTNSSQGGIRSSSENIETVLTAPIQNDTLTTP